MAAELDTESAPLCGRESLTVPEGERLTLTWDNVIVKFHPQRSLWDRIAMKPAESPKTLLRGVSGIAKPGTLTAIMGSSGAGKTTLLNVFNQRELGNLEVQGNVLLNGVPLVAMDRNQRSLFGYVQQHDILPGVLTVREYLYFTTNLALGEGTPRAKKLRRIEELLQQLSLKKCADTPINGKGCISGGEKKRLSVACKLIGNARILFLDEPTTGLDSYIAKVLINNLKVLTRDGYNVVSTIHQPSSDVFNLFDNVYFLANGKTAYAGPQDGIVDHFSPLGYQCPDDFSPSDYYIAVLSIVPGHERAAYDRVDELCDNFQKSQHAANIEEAIKQEYTRQDKLEVTMVEGDYSASSRSATSASWFTQFYFIYWRNYLYLKRDTSLIKARLISVIFMSSILLVIYFDRTVEITQGQVLDVQGLLFFFCANFTFVNCNRLLEVIPRELPLLVREYKDGLYSVSSYLSATSLTQSSVGTLSIIVSVFVIYICSGLRFEWHTMAICIGVLVIAFYVNVWFVLMQSTIWETPKRTTTFVPQMCFIASILGGYYVNPRSIPSVLMPLVYLDWISSSFELVSINQWRDVWNITCSYHREEGCVDNGPEVLQKYGLEEDDFYRDLGLIGCQLFTYFALTAIILQVKMKYKWT
ncbi:Protein white [Holothuria leucospilota]|uniref:Protein white n=1 Tax=Holothuria leucospilota TaxID=206669 RepID=A0A9Q1C4E0_HOLLE|nr:Protein white [Holothuria leucospilota]